MIEVPTERIVIFIQFILTIAGIALTGAIACLAVIAIDYEIAYFKKRYYNAREKVQVAIMNEIKLTEEEFEILKRTVSFNIERNIYNLEKTEEANFWEKVAQNTDVLKKIECKLKTEDLTKKIEKMKDKDKTNLEA